MRRPLVKLVAVCLLLLVLVTPRAPSTAPPIISRSVTAQDWSGLRTKLDEQAYRLAVFYAEASKKHATKPATARIQRVVYGSGACGGDLPPCSVMECESGGNLLAQNPRSTASGKWQILDSTWAGYGGYRRAMDAPEEVQDGRAREIYAGGAGRRAWVC